MATTPGPQHSLFMNLISLKNEQGQAKMHVVRSGQPCEACMKTKEPWTCIHNLEERPPWRSQAKEERLAWLFPDKNAFLREQLGVVREDTVRPFIPRFIAELRARPLTRETHPPECIFLTADSASGGKCEFAVLAGYFVAMNHLVVSNTRSHGSRCCSYLSISSRHRCKITRLSLCGSEAVAVVCSASRKSRNTCSM
jgi:hypothetical protein